MRILLMIPACSLLVLLTGCSAIVRNFVDAQPRSTLTQADLEHPDQILDGRAVAYRPPAAPKDESQALDPDLFRYAPVIIQGFQSDAQNQRKYDYTDDAIGSAFVTADQSKTRIDTDNPTVYSRVEHATVQGRTLKQLVYVFWYPRRPVGTIETGAIDGGVLRVTLDAAGEPAVVEYAQTCGCYHGVFVSAALERGAQAQFGPIAPHREHAVEPPISGHDDWVVRDIIDVQPGTRMVLFITAGQHFLKDITALSPLLIDSLASTQHQYRISDYDALDSVPRAGGGTASIFNDRGLVRGAKKGREQLVLGDLDHAGWPRRLDRMLIHWDADRWNDPTLLATHLRLPDAIVSSRAQAIKESIPPAHFATTDGAQSNAR